MVFGLPLHGFRPSAFPAVLIARRGNLVLLSYLYLALRYQDQQHGRYRLITSPTFEGKKQSSGKGMQSLNKVL